MYEPGTKLVLHRYKLPFKKMTVPPKQNELFKWRKGAKRLSDWMVKGGFAPIPEGIGSLQPPILVAPPPLQSQREARRAVMWERVASRARVRRLTSVAGEGEDATLTRTVVRSVMNDSRANVVRPHRDESEPFVTLFDEIEMQPPSIPTLAFAWRDPHTGIPVSRGYCPRGHFEAWVISPFLARSRPLEVGSNFGGGWWRGRGDP